MNETTGFVVGWGTLSLINAGLAQCKGRPGHLWWLISILLGPIATLLIVILPTAQAPEDSKDSFRLEDYQGQ